MIGKKVGSNDEVLKKFIISITNKYQINTVKNYGSLLATFSKTVGKPFVKVTHEDATHIRYYVIIKSNNNWYKSEIGVTNLSINKNDYCICTNYEYKTPRFELTALLIIMIF